MTYDKCPKCGKDLCTCDDPESLHCSDSRCGWTEAGQKIIDAFKEGLKTCPVCKSPVQVDDDDMGTVFGFCTKDDCSFKAEVDYR